MSMIILWLYSLAARLSAGYLRGWLNERADRGKELRGRIAERRGRDATIRPAGPLIWLHAASVGEVLSIFPVVERLIARPGLRVLLTTGTVTSAELVERRIRAMDAVRRVEHRFIPLDVPTWVDRFLDLWQPSAGGIVESEIWPNLLRATQRRGVPMLLINARLSPRSFNRWRLFSPVARRLLRMFIEIEAQTDADAQRFRALGVSHVISPGNLKFAAPPLPVVEAELARVRLQMQDRPCWIAASTHPGEEPLILHVHNLLAPRFPGLVTIITPRHPERGAAIAADLAARAPDLKITRRFLGEAPPSGGVWLGDTLGELGLFYRLTRIVFIGRSLAVGGGQNPMEPARLGCAVAIGPKHQNFKDAVTILQQAGALEIVANTTALAAFVARMLLEPQTCAQMGQSGQAAVDRAGELPEFVATRLLALAALHP